MDDIEGEFLRLLDLEVTGIENVTHVGGPIMAALVKDHHRPKSVLFVLDCPRLETLLSQKPLDKIS